MRAIAIKQTVRGDDLAITLAGPRSRPGPIPQGEIVHITGILEDLPDADVVRLWEGTADVTWLRGGSRRRYFFELEELGLGRIIR